MSSTPSGDAMDASAQTFGAGCASVPADGAGSFNRMATEPVATAASANPLLKTLVAAVGQAGLGDTLNSAEGITVFAPTDDAFGAIPKKTLDAVLADKRRLTKDPDLPRRFRASSRPTSSPARTRRWRGRDLTVDGSAGLHRRQQQCQRSCGTSRPPTRPSTSSTRC